MRNTILARCAWAAVVVWLCGASGTACAEDPPPPVKIYVDMKGFEKRFKNEMDEEARNATKEKIKQTIKANLDEAFGQCNTTVSDSEDQKEGADRTVTIKNTYGQHKNADGESVPHWGSYVPGSKDTTVHARNYATHPSTFKTDGEWDPNKLGTAMGTTAAHEIAHSYCAPHDDSDTNKMGKTATAEDLAGGQDFNEAAKNDLQENRGKPPCTTATNYSIDGCNANWWDDPGFAVGAELSDPYAIETGFGFGGPMASMFYFGWWGVDTDDGALDGNPWGDFVYKSSMTGTIEDAPQITFFDGQCAHFVLQGVTGSPYEGDLFEIDPAAVALTDEVTRPDGLVVARQIELDWFIDADAIPDVTVTMSTQLYGLDSPEYSGFTLGPAEPPTIAEGKQLCDGTFVHLDDQAVTAVFPDHFYVESLDRASGIRVNWSDPLPPMPLSTTVRGDMMTGADGERCVEAFEVLPTSTQEVGPLAMPNCALGGGDFEFCPGVWGSGQQGAAEGVGLNNIGLLIKTCGTVVDKDPSPSPTWIKIDDGSGINVKVTDPLEAGLPDLWQYVAITGISSCEKVVDYLVPVIKIRSADDVQRLQ